MKHSNKFNTAKHSSNQKIGMWNEENYNNRQDALKVLEIAKQQENERKGIK
jgi:hypothetical protein